MGANTDTLNIIEYAERAAKKVSDLIQDISVEEPTLIGGEEASSATNSLDHTYMKDLEEGKHFQTDYLNSYFSMFER